MSKATETNTPTLDQLDIYADHYYDLKSLAAAAEALLDLNEERGTCPHIESASRLLNIIEEKCYKFSNELENTLNKMKGGNRG